MKKDLVDILACPVCRGEFRLEARDERAEEVVNDLLVCNACGRGYPIEESIPNLLPPKPVTGL